MSQTLLIIGAGLEQVEAYRLAKEKGLVVVGTDMNPQAPAFELADHRLIASTRDVAESLAVVQGFAKTHPIDGVMTIANDVPLTVAEIAKALGLPGADVAAVKRLTDKVVMKDAFAAAGVATPAYRQIVSPPELTAGLAEIGFPAILKPCDGRGSRGVLYLEEDTDLNWAFEHAMAASDVGRLILEKFIAGPQLSVEGMLVDGRYHCIAYADRNYDNLAETKPFIVEDGGTIPSRFSDDVLESIRDLMERGAKALGIEWGTVKGDIVIGSDGVPQIIELAGRLSGNYLATHHIPYAYGVDLVGALIDLSLGQRVEPQRLEPKRRQYLGVRYFFPPAGRLLAIEGADEAAARADVYSLSITAKPGDLLQTVTNHGARAGNVMAKGDSYEAATQNAIAIVKAITFKVAPE